MLAQLKAVVVSLSIPASLSFCGKMGMLSGSPYGSVGRITPCWKPNVTINQYIRFNPLSANSNQHQFSPKDIHTLSRQMVMRINKMINKEKMPRSFIKFSQLILKGNVWRSVWRICLCILGLNGLKQCKKANDQASGQEGWTLDILFSGPN